MSQNYKFKSLQFSEKEKEQSEESEKLVVFETGETRTIDLVLLDGTRQGFLYSHMLTVWLGKEGDAEKNERVIKIFFSTHLVTIKGYCLDGLYNELIKLSVKYIKAHDERYLDMVEENETFVTDIKVAWKKGEEK